MVERDAFGLPVPEENDDFDFLKDPAPEPEAAPAEDAPEAPAEEPAAPAAEPEQPAPATEETPEGETPAEEAQRLYAKRYDTVEKLEDGYQELRELQRRTAERAKAYEDQNREIMIHAQELESTLQRAISALRSQGQVPQQPQPPTYDEYGNVVQPQYQAPTPEQIQSYIDQTVAARMAQEQQQWQSQAAADAEAEKARNAIYGFFEKHPEVEQNGPIDDELSLTIRALNDSWEPMGTQVDISDPDSLEVAYEAMQRPALRRVLEKNPALFDDDAGMQLARFQASILEGQPITQSTQTRPTSPGAQVVGSPRPPVVERAATTSNTPDDRPLDEVDQAFMEYRQAKTRTGDSVFFGSPAKFVE